MIKTRNLFFIVALLVSFVANAQQTLIYAHDDADFKKAMELLEKEKFAAAQRKLKKVYDRITEPHSEIKMEAEFYIAFCALELFNKDAEYLFEKFIDHHPQSPKVREAKYQLGRFSYRKKRWSTTIKWFEQVDENDLELENLPEFNFKYGYALFKKKELEEAQKKFYRAKELESDYKVPAIFYYAHIEYSQGKYETAYKSFKSLEGNEAFGPIVPYYITQILYLQKKYEELIVYGGLFLDSASTKRAPEIARLVGEGYYHLGDFKKSINYFEQFIEKSSDVDSMAYFQLGYSYYKEQDFGKALVNFQNAADNDSPTGQLSLYYIGDCYLKTGNKKGARSAFRFASKNDHDLEVTENALFNYAKLSFELDIDPYHESIIALENFINKYPNSGNVDKARKYLLNVYLNTKNYQRAIDALEQIQDKNMDLKYAYQKIAYYRGVQVFNQEQIGYKNKDNSNYIKSIFFFQKSLKYPEDPEIVALSHYWEAEAYYRLGRYKESLESYTAFKNSKGSILLDEYDEVDYQIGYALLRQRAYGPAITSFRTYTDKNKGVSSEKVNDALLRTGDAYLILSNKLRDDSKKNELIHAVNYYKKAIKVGFREVDYAYFQLGQAYQLLNQYELEAEAFENLIFNYPESKWIDDAKYKAGFVYFEHLEKYDLAFKYFDDIVNNHPNNIPLVQQSLNHIGNIKKIKGELEEALKTFEKSVLLNPKTMYAKEALGFHELICTYKLNDVRRYNDFRGTTGLPDVSKGKKDTLFFEAAKSSYINNDYPKAIVNFNTYLGQFSDGVFSNTAYYMLAECYFNQNDKNSALVNYEKVIEAPFGDYTEESLLKSATINMENENWSKAVSRFLLLAEKSEFEKYLKEAQVGLMNAYNKLEDHENTAKYAQLVEENTSVKVPSLKFQASLLLGNSKMKSFEYEEALKAYKRTVAGTQKVMAAEAQYNIAYIYYLQEKYDSSQAAITKLLKELGVYQHWASKGFILLSDIYVKKLDYFQAKYILNTVIENHDGADLITVAKEKLQNIKELEAAKLNVKKAEEVEVNIGVQPDGNAELFDVEEETEELLDSLPAIITPLDTTETE